MSKRLSLFTSFIICGALLTVVGCGAPKSPAGKKIGDLTIRSLVNQGVSLTGKFKVGYYAYHDDNRMTMVLFEGDETAPQQVLIVRMLWLPRGSKTPVNRSATNASIKHIVFAGADRNIVGVYGGGGYYYPKSKPGKDRIKGAIWDGSMDLLHASKGFADRLGRVQIDGNLKVTRDDEKVEATLKSLEEELAGKIGYKVMVKRDVTADKASM
ncbi:MAG TPA: hypothetical protein DCM28_16380 [Phycisphaerales bacterium]|nr:hypothetical protein [Phycisphaerales bacterium]HCD30875.1 hypothetical protein [Phycisphaerales bacterium]|tara:strand:- start:1286 stop:1921 length:636 start_codon:yes stop_codon:yes gene_type:complete